MPEVCEAVDAVNANTTPWFKDVVHSLINLQTSFRAGSLRNFLPQWEITSDPTILQFVSGVTIEFKNNVVPEQSHQRPSVFNNEQHAIVKAEIDKLVAKGVIVPAARGVCLLVEGQGSRVEGRGSRVDRKLA